MYKLITIICTAVILLINSAGAATYFVASGGNDNDPGTISQPWASITYAAENLQAGDTVMIRGGVYNESGIFPENRGTEDDYIVYMAFQGEKPVIDGKGGEFNNGFFLDGESYIIISGFTLRNFNDNAIWIQSSHHFELNNLEIHDVTYGIGISYGSHDFMLNNILLYDFLLYGIDVSPGENVCYNGTFNNCVAHTGSDPQQNVDGFALGHGEQYNFTFNNCVAYGVYDGFDISSRETTLNNCLAYECSNGAYKIWQDQVKLINCIGYNCGSSVVELDWAGDNPKNVLLQNCTFFNSETFIVWVENGADTLSMYNCIISGGDNIGLAFEQRGNDYRADNNVFHNDHNDRMIVVAYEDEYSMSDIAGGSWNGTGDDDHNSIVVDDISTIFKDFSMEEFHLKENCAAIDAGRSEGAPDTDFDGKPRPNGQGYDIGAYEFQGGTSVYGIINEAIDIYPNPVSSQLNLHISMKTSGKALINIYDIKGNTVKSINSYFSEGNNLFSFKMTDKNGIDLHPGLYFIIIDIDDYIYNTSFIKID